AERGAHVVLADIDAEAGQAAAAAVRGAGGGAEAFPCDGTDDEQVAAMRDDLVERHGGVDILINNAGLHSAEFNVPMATTGIDRLRRLFEVNVMGVIICTLAIGPTMAGRRGATI